MEPEWPGTVANDQVVNWLMVIYQIYDDCIVSRPWLKVSDKRVLRRRKIVLSMRQDVYRLFVGSP